MFDRAYHSSHPGLRFVEEGLATILFIMIVGWLGYSLGHVGGLSILTAQNVENELFSASKANRIPILVPEGKYFLQGYVKFETGVPGQLFFKPIRIPVSVDNAGNISCPTCNASMIHISNAIATGRTIALNVTIPPDTYFAYGSLRRLPLLGERIGFTISAGGGSAKGADLVMLKALLYPR